MYTSNRLESYTGSDAEHNALVHGPSGAHNELQHAHSCIQAQQKDSEHIIC